MNPEYVPMNSAETLDRVFEVYKRSLSQQLVYSLIVGAIATIGGVFLLIFGIISLGLFVFELSFIVGLSISIGLLLVFLLFWSAASNAGHILLSKPAFYGKKVELPFKQLGKVILRVASAIIAQFLLSIPFIIILVVYLYFYFDTLFNTLAVDQSLAILTYFGTFTLLAILIGFLYIVYTNFFFLVIPVAVFEEKTFFGTLNRAWELINGDFWRILGIRVIWYLIITVITNAAVGMLAIASSLIEYFAASISMTALYFGVALIVNIISFGVAFLVAPLRGIMPAIIYFNQRMKKEGLGIEIQIERLKQ